MLQISATDFKQNLGRYLDLAREQEIHITRNGEDIAVLAAPKVQSVSRVRRMSGLLRGLADMDAKDIHSERLRSKHEL
jgi:prevent-host-death family protein